MRYWLREQVMRSPSALATHCRVGKQRTTLLSKDLRTSRKHLSQLSTFWSLVVVRLVRNLLGKSVRTTGRNSMLALRR